MSEDNKLTVTGHRTGGAPGHVMGKPSKLLTPEELAQHASTIEHTPYQASVEAWEAIEFHIDAQADEINKWAGRTSAHVELEIQLRNEIRGQAEKIEFLKEGIQQHLKDIKVYLKQRDEFAQALVNIFEGLDSLDLGKIVVDTKWPKIARKAKEILGE